MADEKLIELATLAEREAFEAACFRLRCAEDGTAPEEIAAGTATLDRDGHGRPVFPPISTRSASPTATDGERALYAVSEEMERWHGEQVDDPKHGRVTIDVQTDARTRAQVEADPRWADKLRGEVTRAVTPR